jgi:hypothetical protein
MASHISRRKFLATLLGGAAAVAWPLAVRAQHAPMIADFESRHGEAPRFDEPKTPSSDVPPSPISVLMDFRAVAG